MDDATREQIYNLLESDTSTEDIVQQLGVPRKTVSAMKAHITMRGRAADLEEIEEAASLKFGLERDMQDALRRNIHQLDPALRIVDEGKERRVEAGFIDILAEDDQGALVVIELKSGEASDRAITQVLSYIGSLQTDENSRPVRGMLIARQFPTRVRLAAAAASIQLVEYGFSFSFTVVGPRPS